MPSRFPFDAWGYAWKFPEASLPSPLPTTQSFINGFKKYMKDTCTIYPYTGQDKHGSATYGLGVVYYGRWVQKNRMARDAQGQSVISTSNFIFLDNPTFTLRDQFEMTDGTLPTPISKSQVSDDLTSQAVTRVFFL
jgi:hypothetical protein